MTHQLCHHHYPCRCFFVPPHVLDNLAKAGVSTARNTIQQGEVSRTQRASKITGMDVFAGTGIAPAGEAPRKIYDCQNSWVKRVSLAREEGGPETADSAVNNAYDYIGTVREFFIERLERNSWDNVGSDLFVNVHFGTNYNNAFWDGDEITLGDGDGNIFTGFDKSLEVLAHELAHGVVQATANLVYRGQPGALNEHFADVFGSLVVQYHLQQTAEEADWLIGNEIMGPTLFGESLRSMAAPGTAYDNALMGRDPQPDHMDNYYPGPADNYGVHINSGIPNKAFYLTAMDIGTDNAGKIWYHALQNLWATADFNAAVARFVESARILVKDKKVPPASTQTVRAAFRAVGLPR